MLDPANSLKERQEMVEHAIRARGVRSKRVLDAMASVPREDFLPPNLREFAYEDTPLPIEADQTISQPYIVAYMVEALGLEGGERVLEIGAGSGYAAAVLSRIAGEVYTVERIGQLAEKAAARLADLGYGNVHVLHGDGTKGWPEHMPYDAIVVAAGGRAEAGAPVLPQYASDKHEGVSSCDGSTCHGSAGPRNDRSVLQNEFTTWINEDRHHTRAYKVLLSPESIAISRNLGRPKKPHEDALCLDCHSDNPPVEKRRTENGAFRPGTSFKEFFFTETGDTNADKGSGAAYGQFGGVYRLSQAAPSADTGTLSITYVGDKAHTGLDNLNFLTRTQLMTVEDAGDTLHTQRKATDSAYLIDVTAAQPKAVRFYAQGRDAVATFRNADNEITGIIASNGDPTVKGMMGAVTPTPFRQGWRVFFTNQHGMNVTQELVRQPAQGGD